MAIKVFVRQVPGTFMNEIFIIDQGDPRDGAVDVFFNIDKDGCVICEKVKRDYGAAISQKPTMILPEKETRELIAAFAELGKKHGYVLSSSVEGKLEATQDHLADMRKLVFHNINTEI